MSYLNGTRIPNIRDASIQRNQRPRADWQQLQDRYGSAAAAAELLNEVMSRFIELLYLEDEGGFCNIDPFTYRIEIPVPWNPKNYKLYGLRRTEQGVLNHLIQSTVKAQGERCLFQRFPPSPLWYLDVGQYPTMGDALAWQDTLNINARAWKQWLNAFRISVNSRYTE